jgi:transcriptional regulator with XRE-family HTH domain
MESVNPREGKSKMETSGPAADGGAEPNMGFGRRLRRARLAQRWSQLTMAQHMRDIAAAHEGTATLASLPVMISKWEHEEKMPNLYNRHLLAATLQVSLSDLGLPEDPDFVW